MTSARHLRPVAHLLVTQPQTLNGEAAKTSTDPNADAATVLQRREHTEISTHLDDWNIFPLAQHGVWECETSGNTLLQGVIA